MLSCVQLWDPMDCSTPGFPVHYQHPELAHSCSLSQWCHPTISFSVVPFSSCFQYFPTPGSFPMCQFFASGGQSIGVSALASILPMNIQDWLNQTFWIDWFDLLAVQGTLKSLLQHHSSKASILRCSAFFTVQFSHPYVTIGKTIALTIQIRVVRKPWLSLLKAPKSSPGQTLKADGSSNSSVASEMSQQSFVLSLSSKHFFCLRWLSVWVGGQVSGDTAVTLAMPRHHYWPV